jgi:hypothetical protein
LARRRNILKDEEIAEIVWRDIQWARDFRQDYKEKWKRFYRLYKNYVDRANYPFEANLAIPTAFTLIEVQKAFLLDMIFAGGNFVEVLGRNPEAQAQSRSVRDLLDYHFENSLSTYEDMDLFAGQLLTYGTSIYKLFWLYRPGWKTRAQVIYDEDGVATGYERVLSPEILDYRPEGYPVDIWHYLPDPHAPTVKQARFGAEEMWVDPIQLREKEQLNIGYRNIDLALQVATNTNQGLQERFEEIDIPSYQSEPNYGLSERGKVHLIDWWGYLVKGWNGSKLKKSAMQQLYHVVLAMPGAQISGDTRPITIFAEPSPFYHNEIPFVDARINAPIGEFYGVGDIEYCESLLLEQRDLRNIEHDNLTQVMNRMFLVNKHAQIDHNELVWCPGGIIHYTMGPDDVKVLETQPLPPDSFRAQEDIRRDIEQVTSVSDFTMGQFRSSTGFNDTATGISLIQQASLKRIAHKGQIMQRAVRSIAKQLYALLAQYENFGTVVRVEDRESAMQYRFIDVSPDALDHQYDFNIVNSPALGSKPVRVNQMIQLMQIMVQAKQVDPSFSFDMNRYVRRLIDEMDVPNSQEFFNYPGFGQPLPQELGTPEPPEELIDPQEENNIMINRGQFIIPKMNENHPQHMVYHLEAWQDLPANHPARSFLEKHYKAHEHMARQTREGMAQSLAAETLVQGIQSQGAISNAQQARQKSLTTTGNVKSPTGAGGQEFITRGFANTAAGNA